MNSEIIKNIEDLIDIIKKHDVLDKEVQLTDFVDTNQIPGNN